MKEHAVKVSRIFLPTVIRRLKGYCVEKILNVAVPLDGFRSLKFSREKLILRPDLFDNVLLFLIQKFKRLRLFQKLIGLVIVVNL